MTGVAAKTILLTITALALSMGTVAAIKPAVNSNKLQHDYTVEIQEVVMEQISKEVFNEDSSVAATLNDELRMALHVSLNILKPLDNAMITILAKAMDHVTNKWVEKFHLTKGFCEFLEKNTYFVNSFYKDTNLPRKCPITPGKYYSNNVVIDNTEFPKHMDESKWRADVTIFDQTTQAPFIAFTLYANVESLD